MADSLCRIPRLMIAAPGSGSGKTTVACAVLQALVNRGLNVSSFKCGPDYIDPMFHSQVIGAKSRNLDLFFFKPDTARHLLCKNAAQSEIAVLEGVMGYYDGVGGGSTWASSYDLARQTQSPVVLVAGCRGMSLSLAAQIKGFREFRPDSQIAGVILNQVSPMTYRMMKDILEEELKLPVFGYLPPMPECSLESRHLGLVTAAEVHDLKDKLMLMAAQAEKTVDLDGLLRLAQTAPELADRGGPQWRLPWSEAVRPRIAVARDEAFCFYYQDSLELLEEMGVELTEFSPLYDGWLPDKIDGLILGGGYPELFTEKLAANEFMRKSIHAAVTSGMPCIAECGGFLYLGQSLKDQSGASYPMVGAIPGEGFPTGRLRRFGYMELTAQCDNLLCRQGESIPAHEFHYWESTDCGDAFREKKPLRDTAWDCVHGTDTLYAGFPHLHFYGNPEFARRFVEKCAAYCRGRNGFLLGRDGLDDITGSVGGGEAPGQQSDGIGPEALGQYRQAFGQSGVAGKSHHTDSWYNRLV